MSARYRCHRDERGWRVPREGTAARLVYDLMVTGADSGSIAARLGRDPNKVRQEVWRVRHPERHNAYSASYGARRRQREARS